MGGSSLAAPAGSDADDGSELPREELLRRYRNQQAWHRAFASSLDNIPIIRCIPGGGDDGCRMPDEIRRVIETLAHYCPITWEHGFMGKVKQPNNKLSHGLAPNT